MKDSEAITKPTIETVMERINALGDALRSELKIMREEFRIMRQEFQIMREEFQIRLDRIESVSSQTRAEMLTLRADFREFLHAQIK